MKILSLKDILNLNKISLSEGLCNILCPYFIDYFKDSGDGTFEILNGKLSCIQKIESIMGVPLMHNFTYEILFIIDRFRKLNSFS